jgi:hypothetical protein
MTVEFIIDRRIFLDIGIGRGDIGFRLVIIIVADKIFTRVSGKNALNSAASWPANVLLCAMTRVGRELSRSHDHRKCLA